MDPVLMAIGIPWLMRQIAQIPFDMIIFHSGVLWRETLALPLLVRQSITRNLDGSEQEEEWPGFVQLRSCSAERDGGNCVVTVCAYNWPRRVYQTVTRSLSPNGAFLFVHHEIVLQKTQPRRIKHAVNGASVLERANACTNGNGASANGLHGNSASSNGASANGVHQPGSTAASPAPSTTSPRHEWNGGAHGSTREASLVVRARQVFARIGPLPTSELSLGERAAADLAALTAETDALQVR